MAEGGHHTSTAGIDLAFSVTRLTCVSHAYDSWCMSFTTSELYRWTTVRFQRKAQLLEMSDDRAVALVNFQALFGTVSA